MELKKDIENVNKALKLDNKLPAPEKEKNRHLNEIRKNPIVQEFFEGRVPDIADLPELKEAMEESLKEKEEELDEAKKTLNEENLSSTKVEESSSSDNTPGEFIDQLQSEMPSYMDDIE